MDLKDMTNDMITIKEICGLLRFSRDKLMKMRKANKFPRPLEFSEGGTLLWFKKDVENWLLQNRREFYK